MDAKNPDKNLKDRSRSPCGGYVFGAFRFDPKRHIVFMGQDRLGLTPKAVDTLRVLLEHAGELVTTEQLMREIWPSSVVEPGSVTRNIADLRKAFGARGHIETISKRGYRFVTPVQHADDEELPAALQIAIGPFQLLSQDAALTYLSMGIARAVAAQVSAIPGCATRLVDMSDTCAPHQQADVQVRGSIQASAGVARIGVDILDAEQSKPVWSETLEYSLAAPVAIEDACGEEFAGAVALWIARRQRKLLSKRYAKSSESYRYYLAGHYHLGRRSKASVEKAIALFRRSVDCDGEYAMAFAGLAASYALLSMLAPVEATTFMPKARIAALNALQGDETLAEARSALAFVKWHYHWDWRGAEREFKRVLKFYPKDALTLQWLGLMLVEQGRLSEAIEAAAQAHKLEPQSAATLANLATVLLLAGRDRRAADEAHHALRMDPNSLRAHWVLANTLQKDGDHDKAIALLEAASKRTPDIPTIQGSLGFAYAKQGRSERALEEVWRIERLPNQNAWAYARALCHVGLGQQQKALECLAQARVGHDFHIILLKADWRLNEIRAHPQFRSLVTAVGLGN